DGTPVSTGAYVDLGYVFRHQRFQQLFGGSSFSLPTNPGHPLVRSSFAGRMHARSQFAEHPGNRYVPEVEATIYRNWCSWSYHHETNGINEDGDIDPDRPSPGNPYYLIDEGTNGFDDYSLYDINGDGIFEPAT